MLDGVTWDVLQVLPGNTFTSQCLMRSKIVKVFSIAGKNGIQAHASQRKGDKFFRENSCEERCSYGYVCASFSFWKGKLHVKKPLTFKMGSSEKPSQ